MDKLNANRQASERNAYVAVTFGDEDEAYETQSLPKRELDLNKRLKLDMEKIEAEFNQRLSIGQQHLSDAQEELI